MLFDKKANIPSQNVFELNRIYNDNVAINNYWIVVWPPQLVDL
jgi:hypothetical protein